MLEPISKICFKDFFRYFPTKRGGSYSSCKRESEQKIQLPKMAEDAEDCHKVFFGRVLRKFIAGALLIFQSLPCFAQYFQFSQYNFTSQRINPARVASSDYMSADFLFRRQSTDGGFSLTSNSLQANYPFLSRSGKRWSGVGVSFLDDRSGPAAIFSTQEAALAYAVNIDIAENQSLSLGLRVLYQNRKVDMGGLNTGSQYLPDRGFDPSLSPGEDLGAFRNTFLTFSAGLHWQKVTDKGIPLASLDLSFFDFNKPDDGFRHCRHCRKYSRLQAK
jgi:type IX secretion system PorP/SprF family membrane protein